jgi:intracellular sulfur oxidation DsrE/DsrF family protein
MKQPDDDAPEGVSEETLNAFVDDQLGVGERGDVFEAINRNRRLTERACELTHLRGMVQLAYRDCPKPKHLQPAPRHGNLVKAVAAAALLALGALLGWVVHPGPGGPGVLNEAALARIARHDGSFLISRVDAPTPAHGVRHVLLHLTSSSPQRMELALNEVQELMGLFPRDQLQVEVVANAGGVNLLRADVSPYKARVEELMRKYPNLTFLACSNTVAKLKRKLGPGRVNLIPNIRVGPTAVHEIVTRLQEGWIYIKV